MFLPGLVNIAGRAIGPGYPTFVVAEIGVNHNCDVALGKRIILAARQAGADAVKLQSYKADKIASRHSPLYWRGPEASQHECFGKYDKLTDDQTTELLLYADSIGLVAFSTPFDLEAVDYLESVRVPCYKIASADLTYVELLQKVARTGKPVILATGAAYPFEIQVAISALEAAGCRELMLLACTLKYPTEVKDANLSQIPDLMRRFGVPVGLSDHTESALVPALAVTLGATLIEKHFTTDRGLEGSPDHRMSADPWMMAQLIGRVRQAELAIGGGGKQFLGVEAPARELARRSWVALRFIPAGAPLVADMFVAKRPGTGIPPDPAFFQRPHVAAIDIQEDQVLTSELCG